MPLDFELYLPEAWTADPERCKKAGVPEDAKYQPKWQLALNMLERVRSWNVPDSIVGADAAYGKVCAFRDALTQMGLLYILGAGGETGVWLPPIDVSVKPRISQRGRIPTRYDYGEQVPLSVKDVAQGLSADTWKTVQWADGSRNKPIESRFAALRVHPAKGYHKGKPLRPLEWLLIEWPEGEEELVHYWFSTLPETATLTELVHRARLQGDEGRTRTGPL